MINNTALITGALGQDGRYLTDLLLNKGYKIIGTTRNINNTCDINISNNKNFSLISLDVKDNNNIKELIKEFQPKEIYNFAARSSSTQLFDDPIATAEVNGLTTIRFLEAIREFSPYTRFCQPASSEIFAGVDISPQNENTKFSSVNPYGATKIFAANMVEVYRQKFDLFATTAILFNHESPLRSTEYVTRKITHTLAKIVHGYEKNLFLGDLDSRRDWGFAGDFVHGMWLMLQHSYPTDYIIATGKTFSVREFCNIAFSYVGLDYRDFVRNDSSYNRRTELVELCGDPEKIKRTLGWKPVVKFEQLVKMMVDADLKVFEPKQK